MAARVRSVVWAQPPARSSSTVTASCIASNSTVWSLPRFCMGRATSPNGGRARIWTEPTGTLIGRVARRPPVPHESSRREVPYRWVRRHRARVQSSHFRPATRANTATFEVTSMARRLEEGDTDAGRGPPDGGVHGRPGDEGLSAVRHGSSGCPVALGTGRIMRS